MASRIFYERVYRIEEDFEKISEELYDLEFSNFYSLENDEGKFLILVSDKPEELKYLEEKLTFSKEFVEQRKTNSEDWIKNIITKPFEYIKGVYVDPDHHDNINAEHVIRIVPGLAFGTGLHVTTKLAGEMLRKYLKPGMEVLDLGCGSGILSILAKKLGASKVLGVDNDKIAVEVARENVKLNNVENVEIRESNLLRNVTGKFDLIVSNILAEILIEALKDIKNYLKEDGIVILSGIIDSKLHLFENLNVIEHRRKAEWNSLVIKP
ncbi:50S ribosomal protein L11 methyltransferase [Thermosipho atlanticus]|uniref:Ribosomal protein L11 methyltransferase n=1 Tax=Thermosipho atlanticus DSM 15807 TaxID=1123380 RepID=A0A1M5RXZ1_9BACT|nr:50S ribosomal protein L11 methyltransferase [Thermosipho atlanticus]SHH31116.1 [LSU ribosomal protein L11P]-lysine N-methyltransferase [Thermosipho atlanticus DSM 15807]